MIVRKLFAVCLCLALLCGMSVFAAPASGIYDLPEDLTINAPSAAVVFLGNNVDEDVFVYEKDTDSIHAPAALVRIMVGAYALQQIQEKQLDMDTTEGMYTLELFNAHVAGTGVNPIGMEFNERWKLRDLLTVSLIQTASDASVTLAATISGDVQTFVKGMNALAKEIGCTKTYFANVTGIDDLLQYTTVRDMHLIMRYAMSFPEFENMISQTQYEVQPLSGGQGYKVSNRLDLMRSSSSFYYKAVKFGRTGLSGYDDWSIVSVAENNGYRYMVIVMGCPNKSEDGQIGLYYNDTISLYRWAYGNFTYKTLLTDSEILGGVKVRLAWGKDTINLVPKTSFSTVVFNEVTPNDIIKKTTIYQETVDAPITAGTVYGKVELIINVDQKIGEVELVANETVERNGWLAILASVGAVFSSVWLWLAVGAIVLIVGGYVAIVLIGARRHRQRMSKGRKR